MEILVADLVVSIKVFRETLVSRVTLDPDNSRITVRYIKGPLRKLNSEWRFTDLGSQRSRVEYDAEFEFKTRIMTVFAESLLDHVVSRIVNAFEEHARHKFGGGGTTA